MANRNLGGEAGWRERVRRYERSGLSPRAFADREGVSVASLHRWVGRLGEGRRPTFVEVSMPIAGQATPLELVVGSVIVRVPAGVDEATLVRVLRVLGVGA